MGLTTPVFLIAMVTIPVIVLYHIFRPRKQRRVVSSTLLFERAVAETGSKSIWEKLLQNMPLVFQIIAAAAMVMLLAGLFIERDLTHGHRHVVVIDASASMGATDVDPNRLAEAKRGARQYIESLPRDIRVALVVFDSSVQRVLDFTRDRGELDTTLSNLQRRDGPADGDRLISFLKAIVAEEEGDISIALFSDGGFRLSQPSRLADLAASAQLSLFGVGRPADNVAITWLEFREAFYADIAGEVFGSIENFSEERKVFPFRLYVGDEAVKGRHIELEPGESRIVRFPMASVPREPITLEIDTDDHLKLDDVAVIWPEAAGRRRVALVTRGNRSLQTALAAVPGGVVVTMHPTEATQHRLSLFDLVVFDEYYPSFDVSVDQIVVRAPFGTPYLEVMGEYSNAEVLHADRAHSVMRFVNPAVIVGEIGQVLEVPDTAEVIAYGRGGPIAIAEETSGFRYVYIGIPLRSRTLVSSTSFPILVANLVEYVTLESAVNTTLSPGDPIFLSLSELTEEMGYATVTRPDGERVEVSLDETGLVYGNTHMPGIYLAEAEGVERYFTVNLFSRQESDLRSREGLSLLADAVRNAGSGRIAELDSVDEEGLETKLDLTQFLLIAAVCLLVVEWALYNRRWNH